MQSADARDGNGAVVRIAFSGQKRSIEFFVIPGETGGLSLHRSGVSMKSSREDAGGVIKRFGRCRGVCVTRG